ncbi:MBL fold metallo-hydrolase [Fontibacillus sp. BL9]|uniref:MBL fold metallo-hydrolase n=1 Tax=Fontibacillus sp. BL9 TaxID=3389971 RepID=UPI003979EC1B
MKSLKIFMLCIVMILMFLMQACSNENATPLASEVKEPAKAPPATETALKPKEDGYIWDTELLNNKSGKTMIRSVTIPRPDGNHMSFAIVSSKGTVILADPNRLNYANGIFRVDAMTTSIINHDHMDSGIKRANPEAKVSEMTPETFTVKDVKVTGIAASYTPDPINQESPTEVIYVYEMDGLRIAYMGALGQEELTEEQLEKLGKIDVFLAYFFDAPEWNIKKETAVKVIQQLNSPIVLVTEYDPEAAAFILDAIGAKEIIEQDVLIVGREDLNKIKTPEYIYLLEHKANKK